MKRYNLLLHLIALLLTVALLSGCAPMPTPTPTSQSDAEEEYRAGVVLSEK